LRRANILKEQRENDAENERKKRIRAILMGINDGIGSLFPKIDKSQK
jgi:hypothetical protein